MAPGPTSFTAAGLTVTDPKAGSAARRLAGSTGPTRRRRTRGGRECVGFMASSEEGGEEGKTGACARGRGAERLPTKLPERRGDDKSVDDRKRPRQGVGGAGGG